MTIPREMAHFLLLSPDEQRAAVQRLIALGWSDTTIAAATRLSVEMIQALRGPGAAVARDGGHHCAVAGSAFPLSGPGDATGFDVVALPDDATGSAFHPGDFDADRPA